MENPWRVGGRGRLGRQGAEAEKRILLLGRRWSLPILLELLEGPQRFSTIRRSLPDLSANVLARRLRELEDASLVVRATLPPPACVAVYALSEERPELRPALNALRAWADSVEV